jgi:putative Holliday junction resolvase
MFAEGRIVGVDFGTIRIGLAITDRERKFVSPYENYTRRGLAADAERFRRLVQEEDVVGFVVGLPLHVSGDESGKSREAREFGEWLQRTTGLPVEFYDERYSSSVAEEFLIGAELTKKQRQKRLDMLAAQIMLSAYVEAEKAAMRQRTAERPDSPAAQLESPG